jgi:hypothetical protein
MIAALIGLLVCPVCFVSASSATKTYECQKPVMTGVEVSGLHNVSTKRACPVALALFAWENASEAHAEELYGCHRPKPEEAGYPYLKLRKFRGWKLSLVGKPYGIFTMSRGASSFHVGGTDFPLNCS